MNANRSIKILFFALLLLISVTFFEVKKTGDFANKPVIYFFDVGQGDSALIQFNDYQVLIDGGPDDKVLAELGKVLPLGDKKIEDIILSHPHADHLVGINQILDRYEVGSVYSTGTAYTSDQYLEFLNNIQEKKIPYFVPEIGEIKQPYDQAKITFLWPGKEFVQKQEKNLNNTSLVLNFCYQEKCSLFLGDLEADGQDQMISSLEDKGLISLLRSNFVKVSHHGSNNALNQKIYDQSKPKESIISVGKDNQYGHPHKELIDYLSTRNITIRRIDLEGTVKIEL